MVNTPIALKEIDEGLWKSCVQHRQGNIVGEQETSLVNALLAASEGLEEDESLVIHLEHPEGQIGKPGLVDVTAAVNHRERQKRFKRNQNQRHQTRLKIRQLLAFFKQAYQQQQQTTMSNNPFASNANSDGDVTMEDANAGAPAPPPPVQAMPGFVPHVNIPPPPAVNIPQASFSVPSSPARAQHGMGFQGETSSAPATPGGGNRGPFASPRARTPGGGLFSPPARGTATPTVGTPRGDFSSPSPAAAQAPSIADIFHSLHGAVPLPKTPHEEKHQNKLLDIAVVQHSNTVVNEMEATRREETREVEQTRRQELDFAGRNVDGYFFKSRDKDQHGSVPPVVTATSSESASSLSGGGGASTGGFAGLSGGGASGGFAGANAGPGGPNDFGGQAAPAAAASAGGSSNFGGEGTTQGPSVQGKTANASGPFNFGGQAAPAAASATGSQPVDLSWFVGQPAQTKRVTKYYLQGLLKSPKNDSMAKGVEFWLDNVDHYVDVETPQKNGDEKTFLQQFGDHVASVFQLPSADWVSLWNEMVSEEEKKPAAVDNNGKRRRKNYAQL